MTQEEDTVLQSLLYVLYRPAIRADLALDNVHYRAYRQIMLIKAERKHAAHDSPIHAGESMQDGQTRYGVFQRIERFTQYADRRAASLAG